jgi:ubiquinone/menaquinone biosynthesis C-methylase UbiE
VKISDIIDRFSGDDYLDYYDKYRPSAPSQLVKTVMHHAKMERAESVVDIGCGTGLSTYIWKESATQVLGIDPSADMRKFAEGHRDANSLHVQFAYGLGDEIPVEDGSADIVSCGQVFHWMNIQSTLAEVNRVLRPGGVFVVYDCAWPPVFNPDCEKAYNDFFRGIDKIAEGYNSEIVIGHMKEKHLENIEASGYFTNVRETIFDHTEPGSLERFEGILLSQGGVHALLRKGFSEEEIGLTQFRKSMQSIQSAPDQMTFKFKSLIAVK